MTVTRTQQSCGRAAYGRAYVGVRPRVGRYLAGSGSRRPSGQSGPTGMSSNVIDVEDAEFEVLRGSWLTLQRWRPCLSIEIEERHRPGSTRAVPELMRELDYEGWFEFFGEWRHIEQLDIATMQHASPSPAEFTVSHPYVFNFYFVPSERREDLACLARLP